MIGRPSALIDLDRDTARDLAERELSRPGYDRERSWPARVLEWIIEQFDRLISGAAEALPGGLGTVVLLAAVAAVAIIAIWRTGPMARRRAPRDDAIFTERRKTAAQYRAAADVAAQASDFDTAVVERFRAIVASLEERAVIEARSGRTADEVARDGGAHLAGLAGSLTAGARLFDRTLYGGRTANADDDATMRALDQAVRRARPGAVARTGESLAVPR